MRKFLMKLAFLSLVLSACSTPIEDEEFYKIGNAKLFIDFPENYVPLHETADTLENNSICGNNIPNSQVIEHFYIQENDTITSLTAANSMKLWSASKSKMKYSIEECVDEYINFSQYFFGFNDTKHKQTKADVTIDKKKFIRYETMLLDSLENVYLGDIHYLGLVENNWVRLTVVYVDQENKELMEKAAMSARFETIGED